MLTKLSVYNLSGNIDDPLELPLTPEGRLSTDVLQVTNIEGLGPVEASVNTSPYGSIDGSFFTGSNINDRNIVIDLLPKPDWVTWDIATIRNHAYKYFMSKSFMRLVFESTERSPVEIFGYVQTCAPNIFSKDNEIQVSLICPDPHFKSSTDTVVEGLSSDIPLEFEYTGTVITGITVQLQKSSGDDPSSILILAGSEFDPTMSLWSGSSDAIIDATKYISMSSLPGGKHVTQTILSSGVSTSLLSMAGDPPNWPKIAPGLNNFSVVPNVGVLEWTLTYRKTYGGL